MASCTNNKSLIEWVNSWAEILSPKEIYWCDGSDEEAETLSGLLQQAGTFQKLNESLRPNSYLALSDPDDVARVEDRTLYRLIKRNRCWPYK